jgi:hypothetical protein
VDRSHYYAVDNTILTKHDRRSGAPLLQFAGVEDDPLIPMDSGAARRAGAGGRGSSASSGPTSSGSPSTAGAT